MLYAVETEMAATQGKENHDGYTTLEALSELHRELSELLYEYEEKKKPGWRHCLEALKFSAGKLYPWPAVAAVFTSNCVLLVAVFFLDSERTGSGSCSWIIIEASILLLTACGNVMLCCWNAAKWKREALQLARNLIHTISECQKNCSWSPVSYNDNNTPISPCISLQWTKRDAQLVNLPQLLLVRGDVIRIRPGYKAPGRCEEVEPDPQGTSCALEGGETYMPEMEIINPDAIPGPRGRTPLKPKDFRLLETPIICNMRMILDEQIKPPHSVLTNECHQVVYVWIMQRVLPACLTLMLLMGVLRYLYLPSSSGHWAEMMLILPVQVAVPLLPLTFPLLWLGVNSFGQARILGAFQVARTLKAHPLSSVSSLGSFSTISVEEARVDIAWNTVLSWFWDVFKGQSKSPCQDFRLLHVLGSITSVCCVDKKGLLSWSNPSAEKIFVYVSSPKESHKPEHEENKFVMASHDAQELTVIETSIKPHEGKRKKLRKFPKNEYVSRVEVLDLTHDAKDAFRVFFDDPAWRKYMDSLKPLGLCILLNTCNTATAEWYTQFSDHVGCVAQQKEETVAVVNRRCLCEVARQIGFTDQALEVFSHEKTFGIYKQVPPQEMEKEKAQRAKSFLYHKIPMPNFSSVIVRDKASGMYQLLTQGTADTVLDNCTDYWNGSTLCPLTELDRKRIMDFYHRNSMAAYCTAFSYKPISHNIASHLEGEFIELVGVPNRLLERCMELDTLSGDVSAPLAKSFSMDSLIDDVSLGSVDDVFGYYECQRNQIFIGMATLQYQATQDFVQLIEKLESACIRFVHFSKENELRSRVFSEKMGLEAGWNCHISLLNDNTSFHEGLGSGPGSFVQSRRSADTTSQDPMELQQNVERRTSEDMMAARSQSAPCVIAMDEVQVKFNVKATAEEDDNEDSGAVHLTESIDVDHRVRRASESSEDSDCQNREATSLLRKNKGAKDDGEEEEGLREKHKLLSSSAETSLSSSGDLSSSEDEMDRQSDSRYTSSYVTEGTDDSLTGALDNRAHLPRGIVQIRPHLKEVDNVPLLVNLFTDCTTPATQEMMKIMQENGEVVLCIGSSLNIANTPVFLQADCSIAIEPLYPQLCARKAPVTEAWNDQCSSPTQLASCLMSLPCSLAYQREDNVSLLQLTAEARHHTLSLRNCFYLLLCCHLCVALSFLLSQALLLPPPLEPPHLLWLLLLALPSLAIGLMGSPVDPRIMGMITNKNKQHVDEQVVIQFLLQLLLRFIPSVAIALICFGAVLYSYCQNTSRTTCFLYKFNENHNQTYHEWEEKFSGGLIMAQNIFHLYILIFFVAISMSLVHWLDHIWHRAPFSNKLWSITAGVLIVVQFIFCVADVALRNHFTSNPMPLSDIHPAVWVLGLLWPLFIVGLNELVKLLEIKFFLQRQRRARLDFGTKLGMNSPF